MTYKQYNNETEIRDYLVNHNIKNLNLTCGRIISADELLHEISNEEDYYESD